MKNFFSEFKHKFSIIKLLCSSTNEVISRIENIILDKNYINIYFENYYSNFIKELNKRYNEKLIGIININ